MKNTPKSNNKDPRFEGFRLGSKGGLIFIACWAVMFFSGLVNDGTPKIIRIIFTPIAIVGFLIGLAGMAKHIKIMFGPIDPKREVDSGYDLEYVLCPHCKKAQIRLDAKPFSCPACKKKISKGGF